MIITLTIKTLLICYVLFDLANFISELMSEIKPIFKNRLYAIVYNLVYYILSCDKCFSFWFSLILTQDLFIAVLISLLMRTIKTIEYKITKNETQL